MTAFQKYLATFAVLFVVTPVCAQGSSADAPSRVRNYSTEYVISADGSYAETREFTVTILKEEAVASSKQASVSYSQSIQRAEVLSAYTTKPDGRRIDTPKSNYQLTTNGGKGDGTPAFSDMATLTVVFPEVAVGDTVTFSTRIESMEPMFPGQFSTWETFPRALAIDRARVRFDYPESLALRLDPRDMKQVSNENEGGRRSIEWIFENPSPPKTNRTNYSVFDPEGEPGVGASTFKTYASISAAYGARARPKAAVTETVRKLAESIAPGDLPPRDTARRLYDWVARTITYGGNCIGVGAVVPHDLDFVLNNRMGDCKDHATLLEALLTAKNIASTQVLINAGNVYRLPKTPVVSMVNHVITYIPSLDLYIDSTSAETPFGMLPLVDQGKPALRVDGYIDGARTPSAPAESLSQVMRTHIKITSDGSFDGAGEVQVTGLAAVGARTRFTQTPKDQDVDLMRNYYRANGYVATGTVTRDPSSVPSEKYEYSATFSIKNVLPLPGSGAFAIAPLIFSDLAIGRIIAASIQQADEPYDSLCLGGRSVEEYVYELPEGFKILSVPDDESIVTLRDFYRASYKVEGNQLTVKRELDGHTSGNICTAAENAASRKFSLRVMSNLRAQVLFK